MMPPLALPVRWLQQVIFLFGCKAFLNNINSFREGKKRGMKMIFSIENPLCRGAFNATNIFFVDINSINMHAYVFDEGWVKSSRPLKGRRQLSKPPKLLSSHSEWSELMATQPHTYSTYMKWLGSFDGYICTEISAKRQAKISNIWKKIMVTFISPSVLKKEYIR